MEALIAAGWYRSSIGTKWSPRGIAIPPSSLVFGRALSFVTQCKRIRPVSWKARRWMASGAAPEAALFGSAKRLLLVTLGVSLVFGAGAALVAWWLGRGVVSAVGTLVEATKTIGGAEGLKDQPTGMGETDQIFRALSDTSSRLAAREAELVRTNDSLTATAAMLRGKRQRLDAARTAAATGTFVWHVSSGVFESDDSMNALLALPTARAVRSLDEFLSVVHPEDRTRVAGNLNSCVTNVTEFVHEFRIVRGDGVTRWWYARGKAFADDQTVNGTYMAAACVDVTERKQAELEVASARDAAVAAARAKDDFLAALSHELRTPLNPVLLVASDAADDPAYPPPAREAFATIAKNVELEARLIDDLLDLTRITQGKLSLELKKIAVHGVLKEAIATVQAEIDHKHQVLALDWTSDEPIVRGDSIRLQQVFWNVLKNAVKFTSSQGHIVITTRMVAGRVEIEMSDNGIGMTADEIARSFKPFSQGDHSLNRNTHRFGGLGLGLAISRMLVELHDGEITAESPGRHQGTRFTIRLPLLTKADASEDDSRPTHVGAAVDEQARFKLLLVEDHDATRVTLERLLRRRGHEVQAVATAGEALRLAETMSFDLVLSDIGLPDADGYHLMQQLRESYDVEGVAITGYGMEADVAKAKAAGFVAHLTKPIDVKKLDAALVYAKRGLRERSD
jgi:signal transduction histidine kinase/CheY-like chemotaxis protein